MVSVVYMCMLQCIGGRCTSISNHSPTLQRRSRLSSPVSRLLLSLSLSVTAGERGTPETPSSAYDEAYLRGQDSLQVASAMHSYRDEQYSRDTAYYSQSQSTDDNPLVVYPSNVEVRPRKTTKRIN